MPVVSGRGHVIVPLRHQLVFTDALIAIHGDEEGRKKHEEMGFHDGWGKALDQLVETVRQMSPAS